MTPEHLELFEDIDVVQVGARNMQNFQLLEALGKCDKTVLLKRGSGGIVAGGAGDERGICYRPAEMRMSSCASGEIRTFETSMRNTLDISAIPMLRKMTHLPIVIDPSHAAGIRLDGGTAGSGSRRGRRGRTDDSGSQRSGIGPL